jgi:hypothetical protein
MFFLEKTLIFVTNISYIFIIFLIPQLVQKTVREAKILPPVKPDYKEHNKHGWTRAHSSQQPLVLHSQEVGLWEPHTIGRSRDSNVQTPLQLKSRVAAK